MHCSIPCPLVPLVLRQPTQKLVMSRFESFQTSWRRFLGLYPKVVTFPNGMRRVRYVLSRGVQNVH